MMTTKHHILFLCLVGLLGMNTAGQNIRNDTILVSTDALVELKFPDKPSRGDLPGNDGSYEVSGGSRKSLLVKAARSNAKPQPLLVSEGSRKHRFILVYAETVPQPQLVVDWSIARKIKEYVKNKQERANNELEKANALYGQDSLLAALQKYHSVKEEIEESRIGFIETRIAAIHQKLQETFTNALARGDKLAAEKKYKEAWDAYKNAMVYNVLDSAQENKFKEIRIMAFKESTQKAEEANAGKDYLAAKQFYDIARDVDLKSFSKLYLKEYEALLKRISNRRYSQFMKSGDEAVAVRDWVEAKAQYDSAFTLKPVEPSLVQKRKNVNEELARLYDKQKKETEYYSILSNAKRMASKALTEAEIEAAVSEYTKAARLFPGRRFPNDRITALRKKRTDASVKN